MKGRSYENKIWIGLGPVTGRIYAGKAKLYENGSAQWTGKKEDVTDIALNVVAEYLSEKGEPDLAKAVEGFWMHNCGKD